MEGTQGAIKSVQETTIRIKAGALPEGTAVMVRCRLRNGSEVILDQVQLANITADGLELNFVGNSELGSIQATIWCGEGEVWNLWAELIRVVIGKIVLGMNIGGGGGKILSSWLPELERSKRFGTRAADASAFERFTHQPIMVGGDEPSPWNPVGQQMLEVAASLFPEQTGAKFLKPGWNEKDTPSFLEFVEWFKALTNDSEAGRIVVIDPYFDTLGLELLALATQTNTEYIALACTQQRGDESQDGSTDQDDPTGQDGSPNTIAEQPQAEPPRAQRLRDFGEQLRMAISGLKLRVLDLRSLNGGNKGLFHDRYVLVFNHEGQVSKGFHLSNSIQWRSKRYPMLITPIPIDVLSSVAEYADDLLNAAPPTVNEAEVIPLYPPIDSAPKTPTVISDQTAELALLYTAILEDDSLLGLRGNGLFAALVQLGFGGHTHGHSPILATLDPHLEIFIEKLLLVEDQEFADLFSALMAFLSTNNSDPATFNRLIYLCRPLVNRMVWFVETGTTRDAPWGTSNKEQSLHEMGLFEWYRTPAPTLPTWLLRQLESRIYSSWGLGIAVEMLLELAPARLIQAFESKWSEAQSITGSNSIEGQVMGLWVRTLFWKVHEALMFGRHAELLEAMLISTVPFLRFMGMHHVAEATAEVPYPRFSIHEGLTLLDKQSDPVTHNRLTLEWLRLLFSNTESKDATNRRAQFLRRALFQRATHALPETNVVAQLNQMLGILEDGRTGNHASDNHREWLSELVTSGRLSKDEVCSIWRERLEQRIESFLPSNPRDLDQGDDADFHESDHALMDTVVEVIHQAGTNEQTKFSTKLLGLTRRGASLFREPWVTSRFNLPFTRAHAGLIWIEHVLNLLELRAPQGVEPWWEDLRKDLASVRLERFAEISISEKSLLNEYLRIGQVLRDGKTI